MTSLYHDIIFGPVHSRRLGLSLGVNLLPTESKLCSTASTANAAGTPTIPAGGGSIHAKRCAFNSAPYCAA